MSTYSQNDATNQDDYSSNLITTSADSSSGSSTTTVQNIYYPNNLRNYSSYTYNIALQATTIENYNALLQTQTYTPTAWTTILKSGGVGSIRAHRPASPLEQGSSEQYFNYDLFVDNLTIQTVVGQSQLTRGSNAVDIGFDITEPNGLSFIDDLYDFCHDEQGLNEQNYLQIPYLLVISFLGYKDDGSFETVPGSVKYLPISIISVDVKLTNAGSTYAVKAIPMNEMVFTEQYGRLNQQVECSGKKVSEITNDLVSKINAEQQELVKKQQIEYADTYVINYVVQTSEEPNTGTIDIGNVVVADPSEIAIKDAPMSTPASNSDQSIDLEALIQNKLAYQLISSTQTVGQNIEIDKSSVKFNSGSSLLDCINNLVISSKYITQQVLDYKTKLANAETAISNQTTPAAKQQIITEQIANLQYPLQWYKIVGQIILGKYDSIRKVYQKTITYNVKPYLIDNTKSLDAPGALPKARAVKNYDYIFTGKNQEVIDLDITFNTAYMTYAQSNAETKDLGTGSQIVSKSNDTKIIVAPKSGPLQDGMSVTPVPNSDKTLVGVGSQTSTKSTATDIASTIYSPAELLSINLEIMGDPDYIKQDEIFLTPTTDLTAYQSTGSTSQFSGILFDAGEIYFNLTFKTPQDYDLNTGLALTNTKNAKTKRRGLFTGFYHVNIVNSKFSAGKFTQTLEAIKYTDSKELTVVTPSSTTVSNQTSSVTTDAQS